MKLTTIPLGSIPASGNIRQGKPTKGALATLAASIDAVGLIQPLIVREPSGPDAGGKGVKSYALVAGYRRLEALKKLKKPKTYQVPVVVLDVEETDLDAARRLAENHVREPLTLLEETDAFAGLVAQGKSQAEVAAMFAVSERYVGQRLQLARLCPEAREHVIAGKLPLSAAGRLAAQAPERQLAVLAELKSALQSGYGIESLVDYQLRQERIRVGHALFDVETAGLHVERDLFDDKDEGWIADRDRFFELQREAVGVMAAKLREENPGLAFVTILDAGDDGWKQGYHWLTEGKAPDEGYEAGKTIKLMTTGEVRVDHRQRPIPGAVEPDGEEEAAAPQRQYQPPPPKEPDLLQEQSEPFKLLRRQIHHAIAAGAMCSDPKLALAMAILSLATKGCGNLSEPTTRHVHKLQFPGAIAWSEALAEAREMLRGELHGPGAEEPVHPGAWCLYRHETPELMAIVRDLMACEMDDLHILLGALLAASWSPDDKIVTVARAICGLDTRESYVMGPLELGKLKELVIQDQIALLPHSGLKGCITGKRKTTIDAMVKFCRTTHAEYGSAPVLPLLLTDQERREVEERTRVDVAA